MKAAFYLDIPSRGRMDWLLSERPTWCCTLFITFGHASQAPCFFSSKHLRGRNRILLPCSDSSHRDVEQAQAVSVSRTDLKLAGLCVSHAFYGLFVQVRWHKSLAEFQVQTFGDALVKTLGVPHSYASAVRTVGVVSLLVRGAALFNIFF
jgi:hypothetical protein